MLGIVYDDPGITPADKIHCDAAVVVNRPVQPEGELRDAHPRPATPLAAGGNDLRFVVDREVDGVGDEAQPVRFAVQANRSFV